MYMEEETRSVQTWTEFSQNTSFHGIKYIFDGEHFKVRRSVIFLSQFCFGGVVNFRKHEVYVNKVKQKA